jgi:uncharacterized protein HemY
MFTTVKRTLCELVLTAGTFGLFGCGAVQSEYVPRQQAEQQTENVVKQAIDYFTDKEYAKAQGLLEQRWNYLSNEYKIQNELQQKAATGIPVPLPELSPSELAVLALSYSMNKHYDKAETRFTSLMNYFKNNPTTAVEDVRKNLDEFFTTKEYIRAENMAMGATNWYPRMNAVVGFLKFARKDYEGARTFFKRAIPNFTESTVQDYRVAFNILLNEAAQNGADDKTILEYAKTVNAVYSARGKQEETVNK